MKIKFKKKICLQKKIEILNEKTRVLFVGLKSKKKKKKKKKKEKKFYKF